MNESLLGNTNKSTLLYNVTDIHILESNKINNSYKPYNSMDNQFNDVNYYYNLDNNKTNNSKKCLDCDPFFSILLCLCSCCK